MPSELQVFAVSSRDPYCRESLSATLDRDMTAPGVNVTVSTEVGYCPFCQRSRNLRREERHLGGLVRTIVTCESCNRTLSNTMGVPAAKPAPEEVPAEPATTPEAAPEVKPVRAPVATKTKKPTAKRAAAAKKPAASSAKTKKPATSTKKAPTKRK